MKELAVACFLSTCSDFPVGLFQRMVPFGSLAKCFRVRFDMLDIEMDPLQVYWFENGGPTVSAVSAFVSGGIFPL